MQAPKKKMSKSRRGTRRAHDFLTAVSTTKCLNCQADVRTHAVCSECGFYRGRFYLPEKQAGSGKAA